MITIKPLTAQLAFSWNPDGTPFRIPYLTPGEKWATDAHHFTASFCHINFVESLENRFRGQPAYIDFVSTMAQRQELLQRMNDQRDILHSLIK